VGVEDELERLIEERMAPVRRLLSAVDPEKSAEAVIAAVGEVLQTHVEALRLLARNVDKLTEAVDKIALERTRQQLEQARQQLESTRDRREDVERPT
jgi:ABC-type transporter Mla subunit MlaD